MSAALSAKTAAQRRLGAPSDWTGDFVGFNDGQPARMRLEVTPFLAGSAEHRIDLTFIDLAGNHWRNELRGYNFADQVHVVRDLVLEPAPSPDGLRNPGPAIRWPRLFLHTWDTNFVTGVSIWDGKECGTWFARAGTAAAQSAAPATPAVKVAPSHSTSTPTARPAGRGPVTAVPATPIARATTARDWAGTFAGVDDGRPFRLQVRVQDVVSASGPTNRVSVAMTYTSADGNVWQTPVRVGYLELGLGDDAQHVLRDVTLEPRPPDGQETKQWPRLMLHTWDRTKVSGYSHWSGKDYGIALNRV